MNMKKPKGLAFIEGRTISEELEHIARSQRARQVVTVYNKEKVIETFEKKK